MKSARRLELEEQIKELGKPLAVLIRKIYVGVFLAALLASYTLDKATLGDFGSEGYFGVTTIIFIVLCVAVQAGVAEGEAQERFRNAKEPLQREIDAIINTELKAELIKHDPDFFARMKK